MEIMIISSLSMVLIFLAFITGLHYGSKVKENKVIEMPTLNPIKKLEEHNEIKKMKEKIDKETIIEEINIANIDAYDGTSAGQKEFPQE